MDVLTAAARIKRTLSKLTPGDRKLVLDFVTRGTEQQAADEACVERVVEQASPTLMQAQDH